MKLVGVEAFAAVAEAGSISEAARRLGLPKSVISERLAELERGLGVQLVQRTTRRLSLTEDGATFLPRAQRIVRETAEAAAELAARRGGLTGPLRLSAGVSFGALHLGPALYPFLADNPGLELSLDLDDRFVDAAAGGYDAVVRHGPIRDSWLVAARLAASRRLLVASPAYLAAAGTPRTLGDLEAHRAILYVNRGTDWRFHRVGGDIVVRPSAALRVNNGVLMRDAALAGLGLTLLPTFLVHGELASGALQAIDVGCEAEGADVHIAYSRERGGSAKLSALIAHLRQAFGQPPYWEAGLLPESRAPAALQTPFGEPVDRAVNPA